MTRPPKAAVPGTAVDEVGWCMEGLPLCSRCASDVLGALRTERRRAGLRPGGWGAVPVRGHGRRVRRGAGLRPARTFRHSGERSGWPSGHALGVGGPLRDGNEFGELCAGASEAYDRSVAAGARASRVGTYSDLVCRFGVTKTHPRNELGFPRRHPLSPRHPRHPPAASARHDTLPPPRPRTTPSRRLGPARVRAAADARTAAGSRTVAGARAGTARVVRRTHGHGTRPHPRLRPRRARCGCCPRYRL
ncbi:hypothetical protein SAM23877_5521 [Streptomyces ambofaciens ATCC 23877]|uniref:Uncharacterized protein n=1 Tax=Streptomyces ambofaciens (strain ATCC 23877 / 3486 / DSM 40053 / JCM 4204 / NBRC 12836 / NRRL B-2516) TaxID=278992 RepID=A0A0K2B0A1_STRA7|nr:hypothetical protein SAM23877_5521 [Streptomyces ambofaciens ATCC 23877]